MQCMLGLLNVFAVVVSRYAVSEACVLYLTALLDRSNGARILFLLFRILALFGKLNETVSEVFILSFATLGRFCKYFMCYLV